MSSCSIAGGIPRSRTRPSIARTASARRNRCSSRALSRRTRLRDESARCSNGNGSSSRISSDRTDHQPRLGCPKKRSLDWLICAAGRDAEPACLVNLTLLPREVHPKLQAHCSPNPIALLLHLRRDTIELVPHAAHRLPLLLIDLREIVHVVKVARIDAKIERRRACWCRHHDAARPTAPIVIHMDRLLIVG